MYLESWAINLIYMSCKKTIKRIRSEWSLGHLSGEHWLFIRILYRKSSCRKRNSQYNFDHNTPNCVKPESSIKASQVSLVLVSSSLFGIFCGGWMLEMAVSTIGTLMAPKFCISSKLVLNPKSSGVDEYDVEDKCCCNVAQNSSSATLGMAGWVWCVKLLGTPLRSNERYFNKSAVNHKLGEIFINNNPHQTCQRWYCSCRHYKVSNCESFHDTMERSSQRMYANHSSKGTPGKDSCLKVWIGPWKRSKICMIALVWLQNLHHPHGCKMKWSQNVF